MVAIRPEVTLFFVFLTYALLGAIFGVFRLGRKNIPEVNEIEEG